MKRWITGALILLLAACKNEPANQVPDTLQKEEMPAAIRQLFSQVAQNPDSVGLRLKLVDALDSLGAYRQASGQMDSLLLKDSLNYGLWYRKALLQENLKDSSGALRSYRYAIRIYPAPDALLAAANLLAEQKNAAALTLCKQVEDMRLGREYTAHCSFIRGVYYARTGDRKKAIDAFNQCIYNDLNYTEAYMEKGFLYYDDKKTSEALQVFQTVVTVKNGYADGYYWSAKCYEVLGNKPEAIANYRKALVFDPKLAEAATALQRLGAK
jgi:tetratricopeptide (TPR) repeat protein